MAVKPAAKRVVARVPRRYSNYTVSLDVGTADALRKLGGGWLSPGIREAARQLKLVVFPLK